MLYVFRNPGNWLEKQSFKENAFKVREHEVALIKKLLCKIEA